VDGLLLAIAWPPGPAEDLSRPALSEY